MSRKNGSAASTLLVVVTFLLIFIMAARTPLDGDLWWHLKSGEETLLSGRPLLTDIFSFTRFGAQWVNHSWLSQVFLFLLYRWGGFLALGGTMALMATLSMGLVFLQCAGPAGIKSLGCILGSVVASTVWVARPELASLVLLALVGYLLFLFKWKNKDRLWLLPPIFLLWSNLHGGYALGLLWIGAFLIGEALNHLLRAGNATLSWSQLGRLALFSILSGFAVLLNPNGFNMWLIPFQTIHVSVLQQFISEWASPDFHQFLQQSALWLLLAVFLFSGLSGKLMDATDLLPLVLFAYMAFLARRNFGPFALVAVPVFTRSAACTLEQWQQRGVWPTRWSLSAPGRQGVEGSNRGGKIRSFVNLFLAGFLLCVGLLKVYVVTQPALVENFIQQEYPVRAVTWMAQNKTEGRLFNEYNWGGFLIWNHPETQVFVDGRTDLYGDEILGEWITAVQAADGWEEVLARHQVDLVMLAPDRPLNHKLDQAGWILVYQDDQAVIYGNPARSETH